VVTEFAKIQVKPGMEAKLEEGIAKSLLLFQRAKGCQGVALKRSVEDASRYWLVIKWDSMEAHTRDFIGTPDFSTFIGTVSDCFADRPQVDHVSDGWTGF
jgi:heme-degrading monooxygenase HmoA